MQKQLQCERHHDALAPKTNRKIYKENKCHEDVQNKTYTHQTIKELKQDMNEKTKRKVSGRRKDVHTSAQNRNVLK